MWSSINSRIIDGSVPNYNQLNRVFRGSLDSARWLPKPTATAQEMLIYQQMLDLFAPQWTVCWQNSTCRGRDHTNCVHHSRFPCSRLSSDKNVVASTGKLKNFSLLSSKTVTHDFVSTFTFAWIRRPSKRNTLAFDGKVDRVSIALRIKKKKTTRSDH